MFCECECVKVVVGARKQVKCVLSESKLHLSHEACIYWLCRPQLAQKWGCDVSDMTGNNDAQ